MSWIRFDQRALRAERPWQFSIYPQLEHPPLSPAAERDAEELTDLVTRLAAAGELDDWNIAHADLAYALWRLARSDYPLPAINLLMQSRAVEKLGLITPEQREALNEIDQHDPLLYDFAMKRSLRFKGSKLPDATFTARPEVFPLLAT